MSFADGTSVSRARRVFWLLLGLLGVLVLRAGYIQLVRGDELADRARRQQFTEITVPAPRGRIVDRHGRPLAASYHSRSVAANPQRVEDAETFALEVAFQLNEPEAAPQFARLIAEKRGEGKRFVYLRRRVDRDVADRLARSGIAGLDLREEPRREYPHRTAAAAVLGVVGADERGRITGLTGLERRYDSLLRGCDGVSCVFRSGKRESLNLFPERSRKTVPGADLHTTLDVVIQQIAEESLDALQEHHEPRASCAVVLDPRNGEILALAGRPGLDPERFPGVDREQLRVPAVQCSYEPGSTFKPLIMAWALTRRAVCADDMIDCGPGTKFFGGRRLSDVRAYGRLELASVLIKSSNIGIANVGQALGCDDTHALMGRLGFGRRTGIEVSGEQPGKVTPRAKWHKNYTLVSVSMGHEIAVTPVQLAVAYGALVNGGRLWQPTLLRDAVRPEPRQVGFSDDSLAFVRSALERVVNEGTGRRARIPGLRVGGKTGTSEKYPEGSKKYVSSFVGFAPVEDPRLVVLVMVDEPQARDGLKPYGGVVAAPVVKEIIRRALPLVETKLKPALSESGIRHEKKCVLRQGKVRVAAVHRSSVWAGERDSPVCCRNPDSDSAVLRRGPGR